MSNIQKDTSNIYRESYAMYESKNAPYCMPDMYGDVEIHTYINVCVYIYMHVHMHIKSDSQVWHSSSAKT